MRSQGRRARLVLLALACASLAVLLAACGSDSSATSSSSSNSSASSSESSSSSGGADSALVNEAEERVAEAKEPLTKFPGPTEPTGKPAPGKQIATVKVLPGPYPDHVEEGVGNAAEVAGWSVRNFTADGTPHGFQATLGTAISTKPDAIILIAMPAALLQQQLAEAKKLGIPVVGVSPGLPPGKTPAQWNLLNVVAEDTEPAGEVLGDWVIAHSPEGAKTLALNSPEFVDMQEASKGFRDVIDSGKPQFANETTISSPVTDSGGGQTGVNRLATPMRQYTDADYFFINSESWISTFLQAAQAAGRSEVTALGLSGDVSIPLAQEGQPIVMMGSASKTLGWDAVDSLVRLWNNLDQPEYEVPLTMVDTENADTYDTENIEPKYDVQKEWEKVWK